MATARQIEANRRNAAGPHTMTEAGKQAIKGNAIRHGLAARVHIVLPGEDQNFFCEILESLRLEYAPSTAQQELLVHQIVESYWRIIRARNMETGSFLEVEADFARQYGVESNPAGDLNRSAQLAMAFAKNGKLFDKISRYETTAERSYYRAIHELQKIQKQSREGNRLETPVQETTAPPQAIEPSATPTAEFRSVPQNRPNPAHVDLERADMCMSEAEFDSFLDEITAPPTLKSR